MADIGYVKSLLAGIPDERTRRILMQAFEHTYGNLRFGAPSSNRVRAENFQSYFQTSTSADASSTPFSFTHGLATAPRLAIPCLNLTSSGGQLVPLIVDRAADARRVYLRSTSTAASLLLLVE